MAARRVGDGSQPAYAEPVARLVIGIGDVLGCGPRISDRREPIQRVETVIGDDAACIDGLHPIAVGVVVKDRRAGVGADLLDQIAEAIVGCISWRCRSGR